MGSNLLIKLVTKVFEIEVTYWSSRQSIRKIFLKTLSRDIETYWGSIFMQCNIEFEYTVLTPLLLTTLLFRSRSNRPEKYPFIWLREDFKNKNRKFSELGQKGG